MSPLYSETKKVFRAMKKTAVRGIVEANIRGLQAKLGLSSIKIDVTYGPCSQTSWVGECTRLYDYGTARIIIDPARHTDEAEVLDTLTHELLHALLAPFDLFYESAARASSKSELEILDRVYAHSQEATVRALEGMLRYSQEAKPFSSSS